MKKVNTPSQKLLLEDHKKGIGWYVINIATLIFCIKDNGLNILLEKRRTAPEENKWMIPGKFLNYGFSPVQTAQIRLGEILGNKESYIEQLYLFGDPNREFGKRLVTSTYMLLVPTNNLITNDKKLEWFPIKKLPSLAFDTKQIIDYGVNKLIDKAENSNIVFGLLPKKFTLTQLQKTYEIILEKKLNKRNFRAKMEALLILRETGEIDREGAHRPAKLFQFKKREVVIFD